MQKQNCRLRFLLRIHLYGHQAMLHCWRKFMGVVRQSPVGEVYKPSRRISLYLRHPRRRKYKFKTKLSRNSLPCLRLCQLWAVENLRQLQQIIRLMNFFKKLRGFQNVRNTVEFGFLEVFDSPRERRISLQNDIVRSGCMPIWSIFFCVFQAKLHFKRITSLSFSQSCSFHSPPLPPRLDWNSHHKQF